MGKEGKTGVTTRRGEGTKPEEVASRAASSTPKTPKSSAKKTFAAFTKGERVPTTRPSFTYADLKKAIPAHCFERSLWKSTAYLVADLTGIVLLAWFSFYFDAIGQAAGSVWVTWALWTAYWWFQGLLAVGLWVVAHECGHEAYSPYQNLNDTIGLLVHSCILVPYFSWKFSHAKHHAKTGNVEKDEAFVPVIGTADEERVPSFLWSAVNFVVLGLAGWVIYMTTHIFGRDYGKHTDHFSPFSPLFKAKDRKLIILNDITVGIVLFLLCYACYSYSFVLVLKMYIIPYIHTHFWLVMITLMHHTDRRLPHFFDKDWNWLQGAISTVDRDYGWMLRTMTHHIGDTHVLHHLFSKIPHYHAEEASAAIVPLLGDYYVKDDTAVWKAMWLCTYECRKVYPESDDPSSNDKALWYDY